MFIIEIRSGVCIGRFILQTDWSLFATPVSDFLPGLMRSVQLDAAAIKIDKAVLSTERTVRPVESQALSRDKGSRSC